MSDWLETLEFESIMCSFRNDLCDLSDLKSAIRSHFVAKRQLRDTAEQLGILILRINDFAYGKD